MTARIVELFGYSPADQSQVAKSARANETCLFLGSKCQKELNDGIVSGVCTLKPATSGPVICCPYRLYFDDYSILVDVSQQAFGPKVQLVIGNEARRTSVKNGFTKVAVFGKRWGKELRLPNRGKGGAYFVDWILARLNSENELEEFVAVEVQSIDTTGNYRDERAAYMAQAVPIKPSKAGFNWENVNKRILPQLIYKGHVLRRERLCKKGLYFVCPGPIYKKIQERLGGNLLGYQPHPGALTFLWYDLGPSGPAGTVSPVFKSGIFTTTVDQVANAFTSPTNLPDANVYEAAINAELMSRI